ncbi:hypothetical protein XF24_00028 [candidate division SR1 bacterium Aalborg_AAW-1]|nr:hypothetical protein XF24_00028 [candidate division SR1 bacterium Aalborg_AAW-1]
MIALIIGVVYTYASIYVPSIYLAVLLTIAFPLGVIYTAEYLTKLLKIQHSGYVKGIVFSAIVIAFILSWVLWISYHTGKGFFPIDSILQHLKKPISLWRDMLMLLGRGTRTIEKGEAIKGILLGVLWIIEACIILGTSRFISGKQAKKPFRRSTDDWAVHTISANLNPITKDEFQLFLHNKDYTRISADDGNNKQYSTFEIYTGEDNTYYATLMIHTVNNDNVHNKEVIEYVAVPKEFIQYLTKHNLLRLS